MGDGTAIEWTDATWNPVTGCAIVSPGCTNCYAMKLAGMRLRRHQSRAGLTMMSKAGPVWNGRVRLNEEWLTQPLQWKRPRRIFVCAHGDLFAENVPDEWIDRVFAVMALSRHHTFQVLTKRASRMRAYVSGFDCDGARRFNVAAAAGRMMEDGDNAHDEVANASWPLPNVWLGVSAERQQEADERVPELLATPAAIRFVSAEPLLGPIDFTDINGQVPEYGTVKAHGTDTLTPHNRSLRPQLDWIIVGGESGQDARPMHPAWARAIRDQCAEAGVPFFFKQWGEWVGAQVYAEGDRGGLTRSQAQGEPFYGKRSHWWSGDAFGAEISISVGKKRAGRLLDGVEHNAMPSSREVPAL